MDYVLKFTEENLSESCYSLKTKIFWTINEIESWDNPLVKCSICGKPFYKMNIKKLNEGYKKTCSISCNRKLAQMHIEQKMLQKYGVKNAFQLQLVIQNNKNNQNLIQDKKNQTHRRNKSFKSSEPENEGYKILSQISKNIIRNYTSPKYPFKCDYYLVDKDIYIELNQSWTHGGMPYDASKESCISQLKMWQDKSKMSRYYLNAIETWTIRDIKKRNLAKENKLNYIEFWNISDLKAWVDNQNKEENCLLVPWDRKLAKYQFNYLTKKDLKDKPFPKCNNNNYIIKYFQQDTFYKNEKLLWQDPIKRQKLIENRIKYLNKQPEELTSLDLLDGFKKSGIYYGYSHFNPLIFKWFIQKYDLKSVYDPCGGWGHRLLGSTDLDMYIYNDLSKQTKENVDNIIKYFGLKHCKTFNNDASNFIPKENFEAMFTCPPYFNIEKYDCEGFKDESCYEKFVDSLFDVFKKKTSCKLFGLVTREDMLYKHTNYIEKYLVSQSHEKYINKSLNNIAEWLFIFEK